MDSQASLRIDGQESDTMPSIAFQNCGLGWRTNKGGSNENIWKSKLFLDQIFWWKNSLGAHSNIERFPFKIIGIIGALKIITGMSGPRGHQAATP
jgi:hypothetical protein